MRYLKLSLRIFFYLVLVALVFVSSAVAVLTLTERGRDNLAGILSDLASSPGQTVDIKGIAGIWSGHLTAETIMVSDAEGGWLAVRGAEIDWSPLALLSSTFKADRIFARRVEVARLPKASGAPKKQGGSSLPIDLELAKIELPDIALGEALAGGVAAISASGAAHAKASPLQVEADFKLARTDGQAGAAEGALRFVPDQNVIDLNVRASEPAGGIIANLLKLPGAPPVELAVMGTGPLDDWAVTGTFAVDGAVVTSLQGRHRLTAEGRLVEAKGDGSFQRFVPEALRPLLAGRTVFDVAGTATAAGGITIERASLASDTLKATASGMVDPTGASDLAVELAANGAGVPLSFGTAESPIDMVLQSASVRAIGDGVEPNLDIAATLARVATNDARLENLAIALHSDAFNIRARTGPVTGNATASALVIANPTVAPLVAGKISVALEGVLAADALTVTAGSMTSDALSGAVNGRVSLADGSITLELKADVASAALPPALRPALAERVALTANILRDTQGQVSANPFSISSGELAASGTVRSANGTVDADIKGRLGNVGLLASQVSGAIDVSLTAKGSIVAPDVSVTLTSERLQAAGRELTGVTMTADAKADAAAPAANLTLAATFAGQPLQGKATVALVEGRPDIKGLSLAVAGNTLSGDLAFNQLNQPAGTLALAFPDLAPLAALAGQTAAGDLNGTVQFSSVDGKPQVALDAKAASVSRGDLSASDVTVSAVVADYLAAPVVAGTINAATAASGSTVARDIAVRLARDGEWTGFDGGATVQNIPATAAGRVRLADGAVVVELTKAEAALKDFAAVLAGPSTVRVAGGTTTLDGLAFDVAGGTATITGTVGAALDVTASFTAPQAGAPLTFGGSDNPINLTVQSASVKATGPAAEPALDITALLSSASTKSARIENLALALQSPGFNIAGRSGPVSGNATADAFVIDDPNIAPLVSGKIKAGLAGTLTTDTLTVTTGTVQSDALKGGFSGDVSLADGSISLQLDAEIVSAALPAAVRGVLGENTTVSGKVARDAAGAFSADGLSIDSGSLKATGTVRLDDKAIDAQLSGALADVSLLAKDAAGAIAFALSAKGDPSAPDVSLTVDSDKLQAAGREITGLKLSATGKADLAKPSADVSLTGSVAGEALTGKATLTTADGQRKVNGLTLSLGQNRISGDLVLDEKFLPLGTVDFNLPNIGSLAALALDKAEGDLSGTVTFGNTDGKPDLTVAAKTASIARGDMSARDVEINATVSNYLAGPVVAGRVRAKNATSGTTVAKDVDVTLTRDGDWTGFDGGATVRDIPARATGRVQVADGRTVIELKSAEATINGVKIPIGSTGVSIENGAAELQNVEIQLGTGKATISGTTGENLNLDITLTDVPASLANPFVPNLEASGLVTGTAKVTGPAANPSAVFDIRVAGAETSHTRAAKLGPVEVTAKGKYADKLLTFDATVAGRNGLNLKGNGTVNLADPANPAIDVNLQFASVPAALANMFAAKLDAAGSLSGTAKVTGTPGNPVASFLVKLAGGETAQTRAAGVGPLDVTSTGKLADKRLAFDATLTGRGGLNVKGTGAVNLADPANPALNADLKLAAVPASLANGFVAGLDAAGSISGTAKITGSPANPAARYTIDWRDAQTSQTRAAGFGALAVTSSGDFASGKLNFNVNAGGGGLGMKAGGNIDTRSRALSVDVTGNVPFGFLTPRLAAQGLSLTGGADVNLQIRGSMSAPSINGTVRTAGARFVNSRSAIAINDISAEVALGGTVATVRTLTGTLSSGGTVSGSGTVSIDAGRGFPAHLAIKIANGRYTDGRVVTTTLNGDLAIRGPLVSTPTLSGTIELGRTVITVPDKLPGSLAALDVKHRNAPPAVLKQDKALRPAETASGASGALNLDVTVNANNQIFVQGRGLDAELGGNLRLTGSTGAPQAIGEFELTRGRLSVLGKRLTFTRGTITFSGSLVPYIDFAANSTAGDATVTVTVSGLANNPNFDFTSVPQLPEDEVLARLIFGRSLSNLSPLQIAQLAEAAAQFAGIGGSTTLLESLRSQLGVDDLDIRTNEQGDTAVAVGKYLNDRTYLSIEKGDKAGSGRATIDLDVGRGVKLRGQATDDGQAIGGVFFEREY